MHLDKPTYIVHVHVYVGHFLTGARSQKTIKIKRLSVLTCKTQKKRRPQWNWKTKTSIFFSRDANPAVELALPDVRRKDNVLN